MKRITTLLGVLALALTFGAGQAVADDGAGAAQTAGQSAPSGQMADGSGSAYQGGASNSASSIRVLSPGNDGGVTQSNSTTAAAIAANANKTNQDTTQSQTGGAPGSDYTQIAGQEAKNKQDADADAKAVQIAPSNDGQSIRVLSPGNSGDLTQSNSATAGAAALNGNKTDQSIDQSQTGGTQPSYADGKKPDEKSGYGSDYTQVAGQDASNKQDADADATAVQLKPSNTASSIRVLSPGDDGDVSQSNDATALGIAANGNKTDQSTEQSQGGAPAPSDARKPDEKSGYGSDYTQIAGQDASNKQDADADATAVQLKPSNTASSIRVLSPGDDGDVSQSNSTTAVAAALNGNKTDQSIDQSQSGSGSDYTQVAGQDASNKQDADADATAVQLKPSNTASSIRVLSPGDGGDVSQSNSTTAVAAALNGNKTDQSIDQSQTGGYADRKKPDDKSGHGSSYTQVAGQDASNKQDADADATAVQLKPSNTASSIRVLSPGDDGDVSQSNDATAIGIAANLNKTDQSIDQEQSGAGQGSDYTQVAGQDASNKQDADADAKAVQVKPSNDASSIRVLSKGDGGDVSQSNSATALAAGLNFNKTDQSIDQSQTGGYADGRKPEDGKYDDGKKPEEKSGHGSSYTQIAGQEASNKQDADADATAVQVKPSNSYDPIRVLSKGDDGDVTQSNDATAIGIAANLNKTEQSIDQSQTGGGHGGSYLQVAGQGAWSHQDADADATAIQKGASNEYAPIRVKSRGGHGSVEQSNDVTALAVALNLNETCQALMQEQTGKGSDALQVAGQGSWDDQRGGAWSRAIQGGKKKHNKR